MQEHFAHVAEKFEKSDVAAIIAHNVRVRFANSVMTVFTSHGALLFLSDIAS